MLRETRLLTCWKRHKAPSFHDAKGLVLSLPRTPCDRVHFLASRKTAKLCASLCHTGSVIKEATVPTPRLACGGRLLMICSRTRLEPNSKSFPVDLPVKAGCDEPAVATGGQGTRDSGSFAAADNPLQSQKLLVRFFCAKSTHRWQVQVLQ